MDCGVWYSRKVRGLHGVHDNRPEYAAHARNGGAGARVMLKGSASGRGKPRDSRAGSDVMRLWPAHGFWEQATANPRTADASSPPEPARPAGAAIVLLRAVPVCRKVSGNFAVLKGRHAVSKHRGKSCKRGAPTSMGRSGSSPRSRVEPLRTGRESALPPP